MTGTLSILVLMLAAEPSSSVPQATTEAQIARLKSPNKAPNLGYSFNYPDDYDHQAQKEVLDAYDRLKKMGKDAFPVLLAHGDDKAYSLTVLGAGYHDLSVGEVCLRLIESQVLTGGVGYKVRDGADGKSHTPPRYFYKKYYAENGSRQSGLKKWYDEHKDQTLREMQIEGLKWRVEQEKAIGFRNESDKEYFLRPLEKALNDLQKQ